MEHDFSWHFVTHVAHTTTYNTTFTLIRPGLDCMINCFVFGDAINRWCIQRLFHKHTKLCIHSPVNARASILFLSGTDGSLFAWLLSLRPDWEVELEENKSVNFALLTAHTPACGLLKGFQTPAAVVDRKTGSQVIRNQFDLCWKQPGRTRLPIWTLQRQTDLKLNGNMIIQGWINVLPLGIHYVPFLPCDKDFHIVTAGSAKSPSRCLNLFPSLNYSPQNTESDAQFLLVSQPQLCSSKFIHVT